MPARRNWLSRLGKKARRTNRRGSSRLESMERLETRTLMAADPTIAWSSYLGNTSRSETVQDAWVAPDGSVLVQWSGGPSARAGIQRFAVNSLTAAHPWNSNQSGRITIVPDHHLMGFLEDTDWQATTRHNYFRANMLSRTSMRGDYELPSSDPLAQQGPSLDWSMPQFPRVAGMVFSTEAGVDYAYIYGDSVETGWARNGADLTNEFDSSRFFDDLIESGQATGRDGFVAKVDLRNGNLNWSTLIGNQNRDWLNSLAIGQSDGKTVLSIAGVSRTPMDGVSFGLDLFNPNIREILVSLDEWRTFPQPAWVENLPTLGFDTTFQFPNPNSSFIDATSLASNLNDVDDYLEGFVARLSPNPHSPGVDDQIQWGSFLSPQNQPLWDPSTSRYTGSSVTFDSKTADLTYIDSDGSTWVVFDKSRVAKFDPNGRMVDVQSFPYLPVVTKQVVLGRHLYALGYDASGRSVVGKYLLEDPSNPNNAFTPVWLRQLGRVTPTTLALDPSGEMVYLGGHTRTTTDPRTSRTLQVDGIPELDYEPFRRLDGSTRNWIGERQGPNDGYLVQLNAADGDPNWAMYIGGEGSERVNAVAPLADGIVWVLGDTSSRRSQSDGSENYWIDPKNHPGGIANFNSLGDREAFVVAVKTDDRVSAITVSGAGNALITDGDTTPSRSDGTDFGRASIGNPVTQVFTIRNPGNGRLTLTASSLPNGFSFVAPLPSFVEAGQSATFSVRLDAGTTAPLGVKTGTLSFSTNDPTKPVFDFQIRGELVAEALPEITVADITVLEGNSSSTPTPATFTVSVTPAVAAGRSATVSYRIVSGTATSGRDFRTASAGGTLVFAAGESSKTVTVDVLGDRTREDNETFRIVLSAASGATILTGEATCTITDDDSVSVPVDPGQRPSLTFENVRVAEGSGPATVTVRLSAASQSIVSVQYVTANGTAQSGSDYTRTSGKLTFSPGETVKTVPIPLVNDAGSEADETFTLRFSSAVNATLPVSAATITILNDDEAGAAPVPVVSNQTINEGNTGRPSMRFTITLAAAAAQTITYGVRTADGTAVAGVDFVALREGQTVTFRKGQRTATVVVSVIANRVAQANRSFQLELTSGAGSVVARGTGTIRDDDAATASLLSQSIGSQLQSQSQPSGSALRLPRAI